jgi:aryl-alcohol dehydrogenase-like predicted oxidoreductase
VEAHWVSDRRNLVRFDSEQPRYSILSRGIETEVLPVCDKYGTGVIPYSPLARGWLAGRYRRGEKIDPASRVGHNDKFTETPDSPAGQRMLEVVEALVPLAEEADATLAQYALAWVLRNPVVTAPILGPRLREHLEENLAAVEVKIPDEHLRRIDELVPPGTDMPEGAG